MDLRKLKTLIDLVSDSNVSELEITEAEGKVRIVKSMGVAAPAVMQQAAPVAMMAAPAPVGPIAPPSVAAARRLPDFNALNGWRAAITKEIRRVEGFGAWELVSAQQVRADRALYGEHRVSIGYIVAVLTCKFDSAGGEREPEVLNKSRVAAADRADAATSSFITHSSCADEISNRLISAVAEAIDAEEDSVDIGGAY